MKKDSPTKEDDVLITLVDAWQICKKARWGAFFWALVGGVIFICYGLTKPITYHATGTFKDANSGSTSLNSGSNTLQSLVGVSQENNNSTMSLMLSRKLMTPIVKQLNLQVVIDKQGEQGLSKRMVDNWELQKAYYRYSFLDKPPGMLSGSIVPRKLVIPDSVCALTCKDLIYRAEGFTSLVAIFLSENRYELRQASQLLGIFYLGEKVKTEAFEFILDRRTDDTLISQRYSITFLSEALVADSLIQKLEIQRDRESKSILKIGYSHHDRHLAAAIVNSVMLGYKDYVKSEYQRAVQAQLEYLEQRQTDTSEQLEKLMSLHADYLNEHMGTGGFIELGREVDFFNRIQEKHTGRLSEIQLELQTLDLDSGEEYVYGRHRNDFFMMTDVFNHLRELKKQRDILELSIRQSSSESSEALEAALIKQIAQLKEIQEDLKETDQLLILVETKKILPETVNLMKKPQMLVHVWFDQIDKTRRELLSAKSTEEKARLNLVFDQQYKAFYSYLQNLKKLFSVQSQMLQERIARREGAEAQFQGTDLASSKALYAQYNAQMDEVQAKIHQLEYVTNQMNNSEFELSSLNSVLDDDVSLDLIRRASQLLFQLKDQNNRSFKEQERLREELNLMRSFLSLHLQQTKHVLRLREELLKDKVQMLQKVILDLTHQQISILEDQLGRHVKMHRATLGQEKKLLQEELSILSDRVAHLPKKWFAEERIKLRQAMSIRIIQELTHLVESKNIEHDLTRIQSVPLDLAEAPIFPTLQGFLFLGVLGAFIGGLGYTGVFFFKTFIKGVPVSPYNVALGGLLVAGWLKKDKKTGDKPLVTALRKAVSFFDGLNSSKEGKVLLGVVGKEQDYLPRLAQLLKKKELKVLLLSHGIKKDNSPSQAGLLQFLEGQVDSLSVEHLPDYDRIFSGEFSSDTIDLLSSKKFKSYLETMKKEYDWILLSLPMKPSEPEVVELLTLADQTLITLKNERVQDIAPYVEFAKEKQNRPIVFFA